MPALTPAQQQLLDAARRAVLATIRPDGRPRLVPITFARSPDEPLTLYSPLDEKRKSVGDPRALARVSDIVERPQVSVLVDRWHEDWTQLAWLRLDGVAALLEPAAADAAEHAAAVTLLRRRYGQYAGQRLEARPLIRISVGRASGWSAA